MTRTAEQQATFDIIEDVKRPARVNTVAKAGKPHAPPKQPRHGSMMPVVVRAGQLWEMLRPGPIPGSAVSQNLARCTRSEDGWLLAEWRTEKTFSMFAPHLNRAYAENGGATVQHFVGDRLVWEVLDAASAGLPRPMTPTPDASFVAGDLARCWARAHLIRMERDGVVDLIGGLLSLTVRGGTLVADWLSREALADGGPSITDAWAALGHATSVRHEVDRVAVLAVAGGQA